MTSKYKDIEAAELTLKIYRVGDKILDIARYFERNYPSPGDIEKLKKLTKKYDLLVSELASRIEKYYQL